MSTGPRIKVLREQASLSIKDLASASGLDADFLKLVEEGREDPPVSGLLKVASALGTDIASILFGKEFDSRGAVVTRPGSRIRVERAVKLDYESLAHAYSGRHMEPFLVDVKPDDDPELSIHKGEEFHYVLQGTIRLNVGEEEYVLDPGDSIYFDSSLPHRLKAVDKPARTLVVIYTQKNAITSTSSRKMRDIIQGAKHVPERRMVIIDPNETALEAADRAVEEGILDYVVLAGSPGRAGKLPKFVAEHSELIPVPEGDSYFEQCAALGVEQVTNGRCQMIMKGGINTSIFLKAILNKEKGIGTGRRLSLVSIFEIPGLDRLLFLTDPGINPALTTGQDVSTAKDIILNAIDAASGMGVSNPKVAILDANEMPSEKIPTSMDAKELSGIEWPGATVFGPLSYDLALYEESVKHKGLQDNPVAGKADVLVVPTISGGNFLYKAWAMTMGAEVANIVVGAKVPIILASRSDTEITKFLTICACAVYSQHKGS